MKYFLCPIASVFLLFVTWSAAALADESDVSLPYGIERPVTLDAYVNLTYDPGDPAASPAVNAYLNGDFESTLKLALPLAEEGNAVAQLVLGLLYMYGAEPGEPVPDEDYLAFTWLTAAANQGQPLAAYDLGLYFNDGNAEERARAWELLQQAANGGLGEAAWRLGIVYENGYGVKKDLARALEYYLKGSKDGQEYAQLRAAQMLMAGEGGRRDAAAAVRLFHRAASDWSIRGDAAFGIAQAYAAGTGVPQDFRWAASWYALAGRNSVRGASSQLADLYFEGKGVPKDKALGMLWLTNDAEWGLVSAQLRLAGILLNGDGVPKDLTAARKWYQRAADQGSMPAQAALSKLAQAPGADIEAKTDKSSGTQTRPGFPVYADSQYAFARSLQARSGDETAHVLALGWLALAAGNGSDDAALALGQAYLTGLGTPENDTLAAYWFDEGAIAGNPRASYALAKLYVEGRGVGKDLREARYDYQEAARADYAPAQAALSAMLLHGEGGEKKAGFAFGWAQKAAAQGDVLGAFLLGQMLEKGEGVRADKKSAIEWYEKAAAGGSEEAKAALAALKQ